MITTQRRDFTDDCCFICGGSEFTWGTAKSGSYSIHFIGKPKPPRPLYDINNKQVGVLQLDQVQPRETAARRCETCGNIQVFDKLFLPAGLAD